MRTAFAYPTSILREILITSTAASTPATRLTTADLRRWLAQAVPAGAQLMIVLDASIVNQV